MSDSIRILIVDDHAVVRKGLAMVLRLEPSFEVVGEAENGRVGLEAAKKLNPDIILVDLVMPEMDGQEMALALRKSNPNIKPIKYQRRDRAKPRQKYFGKNETAQPRAGGADGNENGLDKTLNPISLPGGRVFFPTASQPKAWSCAHASAHFAASAPYTVSLN